ncbi:glucan 1,3-beta-glucosidase [Cryptococcus neoformans var. grubii H99]|uniref:Glucan 1,3-beta-glucosidase n=1 Tax=Cryptococcus neoformans (strain H99 / ATCC 208821 / CBS 10515 / FGSC 9487) TaxID=235443 RepID=J9VTY2_CRYN9|nr:glucan 1,3-beta-glucosidase [Cryptococcus neoformans var. grubii H99]AFR95190.1 glucan 1,3-beta-glucosidase [Cryptococcus neoformans var. grubii H99]AUB24953.1 glucan 1,3-beta-glucosidase [Cryptococcus neoformans var. grubii]|eukprot:XP_012049210.1 glucan 1,3-beta-glucosidase [Cryptococcus neoformans var. grubii H99]
MPNKRTTLAPGFTWGIDPMRGVNIGGWLVLEPWITPSIFEGKPDWVVDEWTYGVYMNNQSGTMDEIRNHWNTWFSYTELRNIAAVGLNTIRIQIGFWSVIPLEDGEPYLVGAYDYLKSAVTWASSLNLKVMVDVHGSPGGQNGFDNSGIRGVREWFTNDTNISRTLSTLHVLTAEFSRSFYNDTVIAIELINEPFPYTTSELNILKSYYQAGYETVRSNDGACKVVVAIDEGFQGLQTWEAFMQEPSYNNVAVDTVSRIFESLGANEFDPSLIAMGYSETLDWYCGQQDYLVASNNVHWTIIGEFVPANTDCAYWLNGRGMGSRYDNTLNTSAALQYPGNCNGKTGTDPSKFSAEYVEYLAKSFETQTWVYEQASGWVMWKWKTEQAADWSMQTGMTYGWIPTPIYSKPHG